MTRHVSPSRPQTGRLSRSFQPTAPVEPTRLPTAPPTAGVTLVLIAAWLALASALVELAAVEGHWLAAGTISMASVRMNQHHIWMRPLASLAILVPVGLLAWRLARRLPRVGAGIETAGCFTLCFLAVASPLLALEGLHPAAGLILAAGIATWLGPWLKQGPRRLPRRAGWPVVIATAVVVTIGLARSAALEPLATLVQPAAEPAAPDLALVVMDTVRADHLRLHGYHRDTMPRLAARAGQGIWFQNARATAPWTLPSHASMLTGRWYHELSVDTDRPLDATYPTTAQHLAKQGYRTAGFVGNTTYCNAWYGLARGFQHYEDALENREVSLREVLRSSGLGVHLVRLAATIDLIDSNADFARTRLAHQINEQTGRWVGRQDLERPLFLFLNYFDAHGPYVVPPGAPRTFSGAREDEFRQVVREYRAIDRAAHLPENQALEEAMSRLGVDAYDDCLNYLDTELDRLLVALERRACARGRETWVVITSDHGEHFGERGLHRHGNSLYRPLVHVPLVVLCLNPREPVPQRQVPQPVSLRDLPATFASLAGASPSRFPGRSLTRFWDTQNASDNPDTLVEPLLSELLFHPEMATDLFQAAQSNGVMIHSLVDRSHTYIETLDQREEVYDLHGDPIEERNLATLPEEAETVRRLRESLSRILRRTAREMSL